MIGYPDEQSSSGYFSPNLSQKEISMITEFSKVKKFDVLNSRLIKTKDCVYEIRIPSSNFA